MPPTIDASRRYSAEDIADPNGFNRLVKLYWPYFSLRCLAIGFAMEGICPICASDSLERKRPHAIGECQTDITFDVSSQRFGDDDEDCHVSLSLKRAEPYAEGSMCYSLAAIRLVSAAVIRLDLRNVKVAKDVGQEDQGQ